MSEQGEHAEYIREMLSTHVHVGSHKPLSYLPIRTIEKFAGLTLAEYEELVRRAGNKVLVISTEQGFTESGLVYAYSEPDLSAILFAKRELLLSQGWPVELEPFLRKLGSDLVPNDSPIMEIVRLAFAD